MKSIDGHTLQSNYSGSISNDGKHCPLDNTKGLRILRKTLANNLHPRFWPLIRDVTFYLCPSTDCEVVYFQWSQNIIISQNEMDRPVSQKMHIGDENRPICYCKDVLESRILDELLIKKCCHSLVDIQNFTEANTGKSCAITNPSGRCCGKEIKEILDWVRREKTDVEEVLLEEATSCCNMIEAVEPHLE